MASVAFCMTDSRMGIKLRARWLLSFSDFHPGMLSCLKAGEPATRLRMHKGRHKFDSLIAHVGISQAIRGEVERTTGELAKLFIRTEGGLATEYSERCLAEAPHISGVRVCLFRNYIWMETASLGRYKHRRPFHNGRQCYRIFDTLAEAVITYHNPPAIRWR